MLFYVRSFYVTTCTSSLSEQLKIETLSFKGNQVERETLTIVEQIPSNEIEQHIWSNYKKEIKYQWQEKTHLFFNFC